MKQVIHLISMPWSAPLTPSIQTGALKAYLDECRIPEVKVKSYPAHLLIPFLSADSKSFLSFFDHCEGREEYPYSILLITDYYRDGKHPIPSASQLLGLLNGKLKGPKFGKSDQLSVSVLNALRKGTEAFIDTYLAPNLDPSAINLIGFTLNYHQVMASAYAMAYLRKRYSSYNLKFICGGMSVAVPGVIEVFKKLQLPVFCVLGEGEKKLEAICRVIEGLTGAPIEAAVNAKILSAAAGIFHSLEEKDLWVKNPEDYKSQVKDISELPCPDYSEYFSALEKLCDSEKAYLMLKSRTYVQIEGSRGCFANCAFCGLNYLWDGFRKMQAPKVLDRYSKILSDYGVTDVKFVDNVCDSWAESFADSLIKSKVQLPIFMELRAHHPEVFWTKLAISGVKSLQIGVEAISPGVLKAIGKGTRVIQNLAVQKYLTELGISSMSNLIICHPGSTLADVKETKRVLEQVSHLQQFSMVEFQLAMGSPIFEKIPAPERRKLKTFSRVKFPRRLKDFAFEFWLKAPAGLLDEEVKTAWRTMAKWHKRYQSKWAGKKQILTAKRLPSGNLEIQDTRNGKFLNFELDSEASQIVDVCHAGVKLEFIAKYTGLPAETVALHLVELVAKQVILFVDDHYLSLPLRNREELIGNYYRSLSEKGEVNSVKLAIVKSAS